MSKPILCLDFDGVIHSYKSGWAGTLCIPDPPNAGAIQFIIDATAQFTVTIYSSRSDAVGGKDAMAQWLRYWALKEKPEPVVDDMMNAVIWPDSKPSAFVTLDDRAITFDGVWPDLEKLRQFKVWYKK